ncbi:hypothetical protein ACVWXL_005605 [Bradyrhizobium sp. GM22.5]
MRLQPGGEVAVGAGSAQGCGIGLVGVEIGLGGADHRLLGRHRAGLFERGGELSGLDLGRFHVRLVERVDAEDAARDRRCHLEAEKLLAEMVDRLHHDAHDGMAGRFDRSKLRVMGGVRFALDTDVDEEPVIAVDRRLAQRLAVDRDQALCRPCRSIPR